MARTPSEILASIDEFEPDGMTWIGLDGLLDELFASGSAALGTDTMLRVFERHQVGEDGAGVFWSIVHGLESLPGYESHLADSIRRAPSEFGLLMVHRLLNGGVREAAGMSLISLLEDVVQSEQTADELRVQAVRFLNRHKEETL